MTRLPEGYELHEGDGLTYVVRAGHDAAIRSMGLASLGNLRHLIANGEPRGRGRVFDVFPKMKEFHEPLVLKQVLHGGLWGRVNPRGHWGPSRLLRELETTERARERGVPAPPIAYLGWSAGRPCDLFLATVRVTASRNLDELLRAEPPGRIRTLSIAAAAAAVRATHDAGLFHSDLNLRNVMVTELAGDPEGFVLDLDRSWFPPAAASPAGLGEDLRAANLARLLRSLEKSADLAARVDLRERLRFLRAYCGEAGERYRGLRARIRDRARRHVLHRAAWKLGWR